MTPIEEILKEKGISYSYEKDSLIIHDELYLNNCSNIKFPKNVVIEGDLYLICCDNIILPESLTTKGLIEIFKGIDINISKRIKCYWIDLSHTDIRVFPEYLEAEGYLYISHNFDRGLIPDSLKKYVCIKIPDLCVWNLYLRQECLSIGCKVKTIEEWEYFFKNSNYYQTDPNTLEYENIKGTFKYAKSIHNTFFK